MAQIQALLSNDYQKRSIFLVGDQPYNRDRVIKESLGAGLQVVMTKLVSDHSETILPKIPRNPRDDSASVVATEILPDEASAVSGATLTRLRQYYGADCCVLPLNDYVTEYAATISTQLSAACYPPRSAEIVKRKHELRSLWNQLVAQGATELCPVEYCYVELRAAAAGENQEGAFDYYPSAGFDSLPENTPLIVKPDELSSSIEIHYARGKQEAVALASAVCAQLHSKWYEMGRSIGTEVRPRVIMEMAIP